MGSENMSLIGRWLATLAGAITASMVIWAVSTINDLSHRIRVLEEQDVPPQFVRDKLEWLEDEARRSQIQIDRIEARIPGIELEPLPPYSDNGRIEDGAT